MVLKSASISETLKRSLTPPLSDLILLIVMTNVSVVAWNKRRRDPYKPLQITKTLSGHFVARVTET